MRLGITTTHSLPYNSQACGLIERVNGTVWNRLAKDLPTYIGARGNLVDTVRDMSDVCEIPFILVGMGRIRDNLKRFPQTMSRISRYVRFEPSDQADVQRFLDEQCEVKVAADLTDFVTRVTGGFNRKIREAIVAIERYNRTVRHEWLGQYLFRTIKEAQDYATWWLWTYNNQRPNMAIGRITPIMRLKQAA